MLNNSLQTDPLPADPDTGEAAVYPVAPGKHIGVSTDLSTAPETTDQGDEEVVREQTNLP